VYLFNRSINIPVCRKIARGTYLNAVLKPPRGKPAETSDRLLAAAEFIVLREGAHAVSIRRIAARSGLNSALISYHFGGLDPLLEQLLELNINAICDSRAALEAVALQDPDKPRRLEALVAAHVDPLWRTPAIWHADSARAVVRSVMPVLGKTTVRPAVTRINSSVETSANYLAPLLPHLTRDMLLVRLRLLSGATDMLRQGIDAMGLYPLHSVRANQQADMMHAQLIQLSLGALRAS
jgi:AcrR family transcriptional regulator